MTDSPDSATRATAAQRTWRRRLYRFFLAVSTCGTHRVIGKWKRP